MLVNRLTGPRSVVVGPDVDRGLCRLWISSVVTKAPVADGVNILTLNRLVLVQVVVSV